MSYCSHESVNFAREKYLWRAPRKQIPILVKGTEGIIITSSRLYLLSTYYGLSTMLSAL